ncbi:MAG: autotransporter-associated beta strand repeat-containing protein [Verrucomicrobiota bacterium]
MKPKPLSRAARRTVLVLAGTITVLFSLPAAQAATVSKALNTTALNATGSWTGGVLPGVADIASWTSTVTGANTVALGADLTWAGLSIVGPGGLVTLSAGNTLTLGKGGIDMSLATQDLTIQSGLTLQSGAGEIWNIAAGRTLTLNTGLFTRASGATLNVQGSGTVATTNISNDATGIVGAWATVGAAAATKYATVSGGTLVSYTGTTAAAPSNVTSTSGLVNYEVSGTGTLGSGASVNTLRYIGTNNNIDGNFTANGILSAGTTTLYINGNIGIGASRELVVNVPATASNLTLSGIISDNANGPSALTKAGGTTSSGYLYLNGANTYSGLTTVSQGILSIGNNSALGTVQVGTVVSDAGRMDFQGVTSAEPFYFNTLAASTVTLSGSNTTLSGAIRTYAGINLDVPTGITLGWTGGVSTTNGGTGSNINLRQAQAATETITVKPVSLGLGQMNSTNGTLVIGVAGNTWGASALYGGTWRTDVPNALGSGYLSFNSSGAAVSLLDLNGNNQAINGMQTTTGGYVVAGGFTRQVTSVAPATLTDSQSNSDKTLDAAFTGAVSLTKTNGGLLHLTAASTTTGNFTVNGGTLDLNFGKASALAGAASAVSNYLPVAAPMTLGGGIFQLTGRNNGTATSLSGGAAASGVSLITVTSTTNLAPGQAVSGSGIPAGAYVVSIVNATSFFINVNTTSALSGTAITATANDFTTSQSFAGLTLNAGGSGVTVAIPSSGSDGTVLNLGAITQNPGGTVNFILPTGTQSASNGITTSTTNTNSILGGWARVGNDWAVNSTNAAGGNVIALASASYTDVTRLSSGTKTLISAATNNVRIIEGTGTAASITPAAGGTTDINTLLQNATGATSTYDPGTTDILRLGAAGGMLVSSSASALTIGTTANDGKLTAGGADNTACMLYLTNAHASNILTINSTIADNGTGAVSVTTSGIGTTMLVGTNTYTGKTLISGGTLSIASEAALGTNPASFTADQLTLAGGTLNNSSTSFSISSSNRGITLAPAGGIFLVNLGNTLTVTGVITGPGDLTAISSGTLALTAANTYTGQTFTSAGSTALGNINAVQNSTVFKNGVGILTFTVAGTNTYNLGGLAGTVATALGANTLSVGANNATTTYDGALSGTGGLTKVGTGTLNLTAASTYSGNTLVSGGMLVLADVNTLQNSTLDTGSAGSQSANLTATGTYNLGGLQGSADLDMAASNLSVGSNNQSTTFAGVLAGAFGNSLVKVGTGTLILSGANTYCGTTVVNSGTLTLSGSGKLGGPAASLMLNAGQLDLGTTAQTLGAVTFNGGTITNGSLISRSYSLTNAGSIGVILAGTGTLTKTGTGTATLSGVNTYTGATQVNAGSLVVTGSTAAGSAVTVGGASASGTPTLTGTGTVNGAVTIAATGGGAAGSINPGTVGGVGTLHVGATTISGTYACDLNGASSDLLASSGALTLSAGATLAITAVSPTASSYTIATYTGATPAFTTVTGLPSGYAIAYSSTDIKLIQTDPFTGWIATPAYGLAVDQQGKSLDPDGDNLTNLQEFAFGTNPAASSTGAIAYVAGGAVTTVGSPVAVNVAVGGGVDYRAVFGRRKTYVADGLTYTVQFSVDMSAWTNSGDTPATLATDGTIDAVSVPYPLVIPYTRGGIPGYEKPTFFRVAVSSSY